MRQIRVSLLVSALFLVVCAMLVVKNYLTPPPVKKVTMPQKPHRVLKAVSPYGTMVPVIMMIKGKPVKGFVRVPKYQYVPEVP